MHDELVSALAEARDITAEVGYTLEGGDVELVDPLLPEWRGALPRPACPTACARADGDAARPDGDARPEPRRRQSAFRSLRLSPRGSLSAARSSSRLYAVLAAWPVWAAGLALFAGGFVLYR